MAFNGYLIKLGGSSGTTLPLKDMKYETYKVTKNTMDLDSTRDTTGVLHRNVLSHTATKIEFETPPFNNTQVETMMALIRAKYTNATAKTLSLQYYSPEENVYKTGTFYVPDIQFNIRNIDGNIVNYNPIRIAFIEY